ncbi:transposase [Enterococcus faecium]|nr:transposase [Enterococcus faecium]
MTNKNNERYSTELKATAIKKMMPPENRGIRQLSQTLGIPEATLCSWRKKARVQGNTTPGTKKNVEKWSSEDKFLIVMESFSMNQVELAEYCRKKGLFKEQIEAWKKTCLSANEQEENRTRELATELKEEKKQARQLEKELRHKEKALAEAAALLLLRKKAHAIWGDQEEE